MLACKLPFAGAVFLRYCLTARKLPLFSLLEKRTSIRVPASLRLPVKVVVTRALPAA